MAQPVWRVSRRPKGRRKAGASRESAKFADKTAGSGNAPSVRSQIQQALADTVDASRKSEVAHKVAYWAEQLEVQNWWCVQMDRPDVRSHFRKIGAIKAAESLTTLIKLASDLRDHIETLPLEALEEMHRLSRENDAESAAIADGSRKLTREESFELKLDIIRLALCVPIGPLEELARDFEKPLHEREPLSGYLHVGRIVVAARQVPSPHNLHARELPRFIRIASEAERRLACGDTKKDPTATRKRAAEITKLAAEAYEDITGGKIGLVWDPVEEKKGGPFVRRLGRLIEILNVTSSRGKKVSAESQARLLKRRRKDAEELSSTN